MDESLMNHSYEVRGKQLPVSQIVWEIIFNAQEAWRHKCTKVTENAKLKTMNINQNQVNNYNIGNQSSKHNLRENLIPKDHGNICMWVQILIFFQRDLYDLCPIVQNRSHIKRGNCFEVNDLGFIALYKNKPF